MGKKSFHENHFFMDKWCNFPLRILLYCRCSQLTKARREFRGLCRPHTIWTDGSRVLTYKTSAGEYFTMYVCFIHVCRRVIRYVPRTKFFLRLWVPHPLTSIENTLRDESLSLSRLLEKKKCSIFSFLFLVAPSFSLFYPWDHISLSRAQTTIPWKKRLGPKEIGCLLL